MNLLLLRSREKVSSNPSPSDDDEDRKSMCERDLGALSCAVGRCGR